MTKKSAKKKCQKEVPTRSGIMHMRFRIFKIHQGKNGKIVYTFCMPHDDASQERTHGGHPQMVRTVIIKSESIN